MQLIIIIIISEKFGYDPSDNRGGLYHLYHTLHIMYSARILSE